MTDVIGEACALAITDLNTTINHEPRVLDLLLAKRLGFERPRAIRQIIERNLPELEMHGSLATQRGKSRGQEFTEYWLSEGQALAVCALSRTPQAAAIRHQLITVFMAYRRGQLPAVNPAREKIVDTIMSLPEPQRNAAILKLEGMARQIGKRAEAAQVQQRPTRILPGPLFPEVAAAPDITAQAADVRARIEALYEAGYVMHVPEVDAGLLRRARLGEVRFIRYAMEVA